MIDDMCWCCGTKLIGPFEDGEMECPSIGLGCTRDLEGTQDEIRRLEEENTQLRSLATDFVKWAEGTTILTKEDEEDGTELIRRAKKVIG
jgi:uncharacterized Zn finger protein (UPF0148 family)